MATTRELAGYFRRQAATMRARAPFTAEVCAAIAERAEIVEILRSAPEHQQLPVLLLAAVHDQVLADAGCELAQWYPTATTAARRDPVGPALERHCARRADELRAVVARRSTQTNEVGRCALFVPALAPVGAERGPLALVDVGTSGGLNLRLDHYEYHYRPGGSVGAASPVRLEAGTRGDVPVPRALPEVAGRIGLDREPVDLDDPVAARWLTACIWPDQVDRFERLKAALEIAHRHPAEVRRGDAVDDVAAAVDAAAPLGHPVVLNSWVLNYLPDDHRLRYVAELDRIGSQHDLTWVFAESPALCPGLPFDASVTDQHVTALVRVRWRDGRRTVEPLAVCHPHGYWLHWSR
ncbi:MAG TPA: DUF2332 domain-containing protein [Ilumatobacter sp.]